MFAFVAGFRAAAAFAIGTTLVLLFGVGTHRLIKLATLGLLAIPLLYVLDPAPRPSGLSFTYASHYMIAHWLAVAVVLLVAATALLDAAVLRRVARSGDRSTVDDANTNGAGSGARMIPHSGRAPDLDDLRSPRPG